MKPEEHATHAENLIRAAREFGTQNPMRASLERQAIAHATLALFRPAPKPRAKKSTTTKESKA